MWPTTFIVSCLSAVMFFSVGIAVPVPLRCAHAQEANFPRMCWRHSYRRYAIDSTVASLALGFTPAQEFPALKVHPAAPHPHRTWGRGGVRQNRSLSPPWKILAP